MTKSSTTAQQIDWAKAKHKELLDQPQTQRVAWLSTAKHDDLKLLAEFMHLGKTGSVGKHRQQIAERFAGSGSLRALLQSVPVSATSQPAHQAAPPAPTAVSPPALHQSMPSPPVHQASPPVPPTAVPPPAVHQSTPSTALGSHSAPLIPSSPAARTGGSPVIAGRKKRKPRRRAKPVQAPATSADTSSSTGSANDTRASGRKRARSPAASDTENAVETSEGKAPKKTSRKHKTCPYCPELQPDAKHVYKCADNPANANVKCKYCSRTFSGWQARDLRSAHHSQDPKTESSKDVAAKKEAKNEADPVDQCIYCKLKFTGEDIRHQKGHHQSNCADNPIVRVCKFATKGCKLTFTGEQSQSRLSNHEVRCPKDPDQMRTCRYCEKEDTHIKIIEHERACKQDEGGFKCPHCARIFAGRGNQEKHSDWSCQKNPDYEKNRRMCDGCGLTVLANENDHDEWCSGSGRSYARGKEGACAERPANLGWRFRQNDCLCIENDDGSPARVFPDFTLLSHATLPIPDGINIIIECDEKAHCSYDVLKDSSRGRLIWQSMADKDSLLLVRVNPDSYSVGRKSVDRLSLTKRIELVHQHISGYLARIVIAPATSQYETWYFFYPLSASGQPLAFSKEGFDSLTKKHITKVISPR